MKTKNLLVITVILTIWGLLSPGSVFSRDFSKNILRSPQDKSSVKTTQKPTSSRIHEFTHPGKLNKISGNHDDYVNHPDTVVSYSTSANSMKELYTYDNQLNPVTYTRQYLHPGSWVNVYKTISTFDADGNELTSVLQYWRSNAWADSTLITNTYDAFGNLLTNMLQLRDNGSWANQGLNSYTYDAAGNLLTEQGQDWDGMDWVNSNLKTYTYDIDGNQLTTLYQYWNGSSWDNMFLLTYTYDALGDMLTSLEQEWDGADWFNTNLETWTYDAAGNLLNDLSQYYDGADWVNSFSITNTFDDNGNRLTSLEQFWADVEWENYYFETCTYDDNGNRLTYINKYWYGYWDNYSNGTFVYNENNDPASRIWQMWKFGSEWVNYQMVTCNYPLGSVNGDCFGWNGGYWVPADGPLAIGLNNGGNPITYFSGYAYNATAYFSSFPTGTKDPVSLASAALSVYPNPASNYLSVKTELPRAENASIRLIDYSGRSVANYVNGQMQQGVQTFTIYTGNIPAGQYILEMRAGDTLEKQKVTILR